MEKSADSDKNTSQEHTDDWINSETSGNKKEKKAGFKVEKEADKQAFDNLENLVGHPGNEESKTDEEVLQTDRMRDPEYSEDDKPKII